MSSPHAAAARACLLAGALGDAWGGPYEGRPGVGIAPFPSRPRLSDDTLTTLATCEAIARSGGRVRPEQIAGVFAAWFRNGRFRGLGSASLKAFRDLAAGSHWALAGAQGEFAAGAGAAMRIAPLAFLLDPTRDADRLLIGDVVRITHRNEEALAGALAVVVALRHRLTRSPGDLLSATAEAVFDSGVRDRLLALAKLNAMDVEAAARFGTSGHVVDTVPLALFLARALSDQGLSVLFGRSAGLGGDADTIASIAGQVAGAGLLDDLPWTQLRAIPDLDMVERIAEEFADCLKG